MEIIDVNKSNIEIKNKKKLFLFASFIIVLMVARYFFGVFIPIRILSIIIGLCCIFIPIECIVPAMLFICAYTTIFETGYSISVMILIYFIKMISRGEKIKLNRPGIILIFLCLYEILHCFISPFEFSNYVLTFSLYLFIAIVYGRGVKSIDGETSILMFTYGIISFSALLILFEVQYGGFSPLSYFSNLSRLGMEVEVEATTYDVIYASPNYLALCATTAIGSLGLLIYNTRERLSRNIVLLILCVLIGLLTQSKAFVVTIAFIAIYVLIVLLFTGRIKKLIGISAIAFLVFILIVLLFGDFYNQIINAIGLRFQNEGLSERDTIFSEYLSFITKDPLSLLFGIGVQSVNIKTGIIHNPHSMMCEVIVAWGIIGVITVAILFISIVKTFSQKAFDMNNLPLYIVVFMTQSSRLFRGQQQMMLFLVVFAVYCIAKQKGKNV